jgi:hypothetical protein
LRSTGLLGGGRSRLALGHIDCMKTLIASAISLVLGLAIGWYVEHSRAKREKAEIIEQMMEGIASSDRELAARAVRAIQSIESGEGQQAVQLLSTPIARYYLAYTNADRIDERSTKVLTLIEQLAKTNQIVAARIAEASTNK